ncbi:MAG: phage baseplate assembly protein V [Bacteroidota bacterium]
MAIQTDVDISIGNTPIEDFLNISLSQQVLMHHHLYITIRKDLLDKDKSENLIGKPVKLKIKSLVHNNEETEFSGIVYELKTTRSNQYSGDLIQIHAMSPDLAMADIQNFRSFENEPLHQIVDTICSDYNIRQKDISGSADTQLKYTVQFNETGFDFIRRLAIRHGQWFLYDGTTLRFGSLPKKSTTLEFGKDLFDFEFSVKTNALNHTFTAHDYMLNKQESFDASGSASQQIPLLSKTAHDASNKVFDKQANHFFQGGFYEKPCLDELTTITNLAKSSAISNLMFCQGSSDDPNLMLGGSIEIKETETEKRSDGSSPPPVNHGKFTVIQLNHYCDRSGNYKNDFKAVPYELKQPPYSNPDIMVFSEPHSAVVKDTADPESLSRIRAELFWQRGNKLDTPWMRIVTPYAGENKGFHFIPEIGEEVLIGFEGGNPERPYVIGSFYNGKTKPDQRWQTSDNDYKTIRSRSGHTIEMIDKQGSEEIKIYDGSPDNYNYSITLASHSKQILIEAKGDLEIKADNIKITAAQNLELQANNIKGSADSNVEFNATMKMSLDGGTQLEQKASAKAVVNGGGQLELSGGMVKIN